jgi:N-acyl-D-aspartate/D-glutamate deacylase/CubicO group peptidase (beta-lactamase class C family)
MTFMMSLSGCATVPTTPSSAVDALFAEATSAARPGAAIIVIQDGEVLQKSAYGMADIERGVPFETDTSTRLGSVSKQFTAMAIMLLEEEGRLDYDDPITRFLPELSRFGDGITIRNLLNHTGGLPDYYDVMIEVTGVERPLTRHALDTYAAWGEPLFAPGERYEYSNPGYELLALIVERASGEVFGDFVEARIFAELGMTNSVVLDDRHPKLAKRAYGYQMDGDGFALNDDDPLNYLVGSGGIYSTVEDLYLWDQELYRENLVSKTTLAKAFSPARLNSGEDFPYGFGWSFDEHLGRRRIGHGGGWVGFWTYIGRYVDDRFSVIVVTNLAEAEPEGIADTIAAIYLAESDGPNRPASSVIVNAKVLDGTGASARSNTVRFVGDRIVEVGGFEPTSRDLVIDAGGLVLAPGFIDTHSHADSDLFEHPDALAAVSQGITTVVVGQDGGSDFPLGDFFDRLEAEKVAINVASYAGFGTIRLEVMGDDFRRPATPEEVEQMRALLREEMLAGARGLASGLEYDPGIYSSREEVVALASEAAAFGGRYISHIRSEDRWFWDAIGEIIEIGRETEMPVQVSHIKLALRRELGKANRLIEILDEARASGVDISADIYPYPYWESTLTVLFPDRDFENRETAEFALSQITTPEGAHLGIYKPNPEYAGKTLREISDMRGTDPATTLMDLIREAQVYEEKTGEADVESVIATSMDEADIERLMNWPHTNLCTDGSLVASHPRGFGSYPRFLGRYVRERQIMDLATAVHKSSGLAATHMGFRDRGAIRPGMKADLVLFDPDGVLDHATPASPEALSIGIERVWVNGEIVFENGQTTGRRPGQVIRY